jgi:transposase
MMGASAIVATVPDATIFKRGRDVAAGIGIVSREDSTGAAHPHSILFQGEWYADFSAADV